jgi:hypothetical protein
LGAVDVVEPATAPTSWQLAFLTKRTQQVVFVARAAER